MTMRALAVVLSLVPAIAAGGCGGAATAITFADAWPAQPGDYADVARAWTRRTVLHGEYQEIIDVAATVKSPAWRAAHAARDARARGLSGAAYDQRLAQARAEAAGPYEIELLVTTWDRRENDLDRGERSAWRVALLDERGAEIEPLEVVRDKRPPFVVRAEFPDLGDFAVAYVARFARTPPLLGPDVRRIRLRLSGPRGAVQLAWP